jgi:hypothetical protein
VVWRFDAGRARQELESLLAAQTEEGFIGHTIYWDVPLNKRQRLTYNHISADAAMTASIQPPALAWAWRVAVGDPAEIPTILKHFDWLADHRDLDGDGLIWIVQARRVGPGRVAAVRRDLAAARPRTAGIRPTGATKPQAWI